VKRIARLLLPAVLCCLTCQMKAGTINPILGFTSYSNDYDTRTYTLGYEFTTSVSFTVNALGYFNDGLGNSHLVGLWDTSGDLLTSATVTGTDPLTGNFLYQSITPYVLAPGTYVIGGQYLGNNNVFPVYAQGLTSVAGFTWVTSDQVAGAGLNFPNVPYGTYYGTNGIPLVDLSYANDPAVPEPATWSLLLSAALVAGVVYRRKCPAGVRN
jgi:Domain of unknown function (DUF4082)